jgi:RNA polymerase sigma-70 factor (ECF subfamily)
VPDLLDESLLAESLRTGNPEAWQALYDRYSVRLWRFVAKLLGSDSHSVADAVQETFLAAAASARRFDPQRGSLWNWLAGIAHHQVTQHWRRLRIRRTDPEEPQFDDSPGAGNAPESRLFQAESVTQIRLVLARLPADYAALLVAKYSEELSLAEMVELFGGTLEAVRSRLARARQEFKQQMERADALVSEVEESHSRND